MKDHLKIRAHAAPWYGGVEILIAQRDTVANRYTKVCTGMTFDDVEPGRQVEPSLSIETEVAQALMDDLWNAGIRPTEGSGSAGSLKATQNHLEDMRRLVFDK